MTLAINDHFNYYIVGIRYHKKLKAVVVLFKKYRQCYITIELPDEFILEPDIDKTRLFIDKYIKSNKEKFYKELAEIF